MKKNVLLLFVLMLLPMVASADSVEIDGIYYNLISKGSNNIAEVTSSPDKYSGCVTIPETVEFKNVSYKVTSIGSRAFEYSSGLTSVTIGNSVTSIGDGAFAGCSGLTSITIPNGVTSIGGGAFSRCTGLTSVTLPNSGTSIGDGAFSYCSSLTSVTIPNGITVIGGRLFEGCTSLTSITIPDGVTSIGGSAFLNCTSLISVSLPNSLTKMGYYVFAGCTSLKSVNIPNSLTSIGDFDFTNCTSLTTVIIGNGVKSIGLAAFRNCTELNDVYCYAEDVPTTESDVFANTYIALASLHVPDASLANYKNTAPWNGFGMIVGLSGSGTQKCATPTISYENGCLVFTCATDGAICQYSITDTDIRTGTGNNVQLTATYNISVYATKSGYSISEAATATLCWIDKEPTITDISNAAELAATPILIQSNGGILTVAGADDGTQVSIYNTAGQMAGSTVSSNGHATVFTNLEPGTIAIVKIGAKSVKVVMK